MQNVDEYLHALPEAVRTTLEKVRQANKAAAPKTEEVISYQIPLINTWGSLFTLQHLKNIVSSML